MLQIFLFYFSVTHVMFKFDYHVHADLELDLGSRHCSEVSGLGGQLTGLSLMGKVLLTSLMIRLNSCIYNTP